MAEPIEDRPWSTLAPEVTAALRPELPALADEIVEAISHGVPEYARPLEGPFGDALRAGVEQALQRFLDLMERPDAEEGPDPGREIYVDLGRGERRAGRGLDALLAAYRLGARVAWRKLAAAGERVGLEPETLYLLAESIFAYIDEISGESVEGYAMEQAAAAGELQRQRRRLAALLIQSPPADATAVEAIAPAAGWGLPRRVAAVAAEGEEPDRLAMRLGADVIAAGVAPGVCALVPDPEAPGRRAQLEAALEGRLAALGPSVPWRQAAISAKRARATLELAQHGAIAGESALVAAADHSLALLLNADRGLARDLAESALAPLADETDASRERLVETLREWIRGQGRTEQVAATLHVHPQTVRYRLGRLRELFGGRLDDPDLRFELELGLRVMSGEASD